MSDPEIEEVAGIITTALLTYQANRGMDRTARARHIITTLEAEGWHLVKEEP